MSQSAFLVVVGTVREMAKAIGAPAMAAGACAGTLLGHRVIVLAVRSETPAPVLFNDGAVLRLTGHACLDTAAGQHAGPHVFGLHGLNMLHAVAAILGFTQTAGWHLIALGEQERRKKQDGDIMFQAHLSRGYVFG